MVCVNDFREQEGKKDIRCWQCAHHYPEAYKACQEFRQLFSFFKSLNPSEKIQDVKI